MIHSCRLWLLMQSKSVVPGAASPVSLGLDLLADITMIRSGVVRQTFHLQPDSIGAERAMLGEENGKPSKGTYLRQCSYRIHTPPCLTLSYALPVPSARLSGCR